MADYRSGSEDEDEKNANVPHHKFTQPDHVKMLLKSEALILSSSVCKLSHISYVFPLIELVFIPKVRILTSNYVFRW